MTDAAAQIARAAAQTLADEFGTEVGADVEVALVGRDHVAPEQFFDPISLGGLVVSVATLAWTVYKDLRRRGTTPDAAVLARTIRVELGRYHDVTTEERDRVIEVVVTETLNPAGPSTTEDDARPPV